MEEEEAAAVEVVRWRPWSDLLEDILRLIFAKLYFADQTRFRAVCKGWSSPVYGGRSKEKLPWLVIRGGSGVFAFDVENKQGQWLGKGYSSLSHRHYLVEANNELLLATWSSYDKWCIFKFDSSGDKTTWIPQIKLENQALFAGYTSLMVPAVGDTSFLANKIYYHDNCNRKFRVYCLLSGKSCENDKIYNCIRMPSIGSRSTWIEPPW